MEHNTYAAVFLQDELIGVVNLSNPDSAHNGLHTALEEHTSEKWDMDFITPTTEDLNNPTNTHVVKITILEMEIEYDIVLKQTWIY